MQPRKKTDHTDAIRLAPVDWTQTPHLPKYMRIYNGLLEFILTSAGRTTPKLPTEMELSRFFQVNRKTVRRALELLEAEHRICRIKKRGTLLTSAVSPQDPQSPQQKIGIVFPVSRAWAELFDELETSLRRSGYVFKLSRYAWSRPEEELRAMRAIRRECGGMILFPGIKGTNNGLLRRYVEEKYPMVLFDQNHPDIRCSTISMNHFLGARRLTEELLGIGVKRPALIRLGDRLPSAEQRAAGYFSALRDNGVKSEDRVFLIREDYECQHLIDFLERTAPDGLLVSAPNCLYHYSLTAPRLAGYLLKRGIAVATFAQSPESMTSEPFLRFFAVQPLQELATRLIHELVQAIRCPGLHPALIQVEPDIVRRPSQNS